MNYLNRNFLFLTCLSFSILGLSLSFITFKTTGIGWDSPGDMISAQAFSKLTGNESLLEAYELIPATSEFYGFFLYQFTDFIIHILNYNIFNFDPTKFQNYQILSSVNFLLSLSSIIWMSISLYLITKSKIVALIYFSLLQTTPIWIGMQIVNFKDVPVATGIIYLTASCLVIANLKNEQKILHLISLIFVILGVTISFNTRAGSLIILASILITFNMIYIFIKKNRFKDTLLYLIFFNFMVIFSTLILTFLLNPIFRINPSRWILDSLEISRNFPSVQPVKALGRELLSNDLPWWYIPSWIFAQSSIIVIIVIFVALIYFTFNLLKLRFNLTYLIFITPSIIIPVFFSILNLNLYNGIRHILFYLPTLYLFIPLFISRFLIKKNIYLINFLIFTLLSLNTFDSYRWVPYSYAYINPIAGFNENSRDWDLDYWGTSTREGIFKLSKLSQLRPIFVLPDGASSIPFGGVKRIETDKSLPYSMYVFKHWNHNLLPEKCDILFQIKRDNQILGLGGICTKN